MKCDARKMAGCMDSLAELIPRVGTVCSEKCVLRVVVRHGCLFLYALDVVMYATMITV